MTRRPFSNESEQKPAEILDLVHDDICGPMKTRKPGGMRYFLSFIDDFSRYSWIYIIHQKSETAACFQNFVQMMQTQFGKVPKALRSDQGGEYRAGSMAQFCKDKGILQQFTTAFTPQQNDVAERKNGHLVEMARCMLLGAEMQHRYWGEAINTANFLQNILPIRVKGKTTFEIFYGTRPDVSDLHVFGSKAFVHVPKEQRTKLEEKASKMTLVLFSST